MTSFEWLVVAKPEEKTGVAVPLAVLVTSKLPKPEYSRRAMENRSAVEALTLTVTDRLLPPVACGET